MTVIHFPADRTNRLQVDSDGRVGLLDRLSALRAVEVYRARLQWAARFVETFRRNLVVQCARDSVRLISQVDGVPTLVLEDAQLPTLSLAAALLMGVQEDALDEYTDEDRVWLAGGPTPEALFGVALSAPTRAAIDGDGPSPSVAELSALLSTLEGQHERLSALRDTMLGLQQTSDRIRPLLREAIGRRCSYAEMSERQRSLLAQNVWSVQAIAHLLFGGARTTPIYAVA